MTGSHYFLGIEAGSFEIVFLFGLCGIATFTVMLACTEQIYTCQYAPCGRLGDTSRLVSKIGGRFQTSLGGICHFGDDEVIDLSVRGIFRLVTLWVETVLKGTSPQHSTRLK